MEDEKKVDIEGTLRTRVIDLKSALEKYCPRNSEGEELELAQYFYAIYVPQQDKAINSEYFLKRAQTQLGEELDATHEFVEACGYKDEIFSFFLNCLEFARSLNKQKFPDDEHVLHRVEAFQHLEESYETIANRLGIEGWQKEH